MKQETDLKARFARDGYLVIDNFIDSTTSKQLKTRAHQLVETHADLEAMKVFDCTSREHERDDYLKDSADKIKCFLEKGAMDAQGNLDRPLSKSINKIGHDIHDLDQIFADFSYQDQIFNLLIELGYQTPVVPQSMLIFKQPSIGAEVDIHQDGTFFFTTPQSCVGFWFALEAADKNNGCLWVQPGGHELPLSDRYAVKNGVTEMLPLATNEYTEDQFIPVEVGEGALVIIHGNLPHFSKANTSPLSRLAYIMHIVEGRTKYHPENWLQRNFCTFPQQGTHKKTC